MKYTKDHDKYKKYAIGDGTYGYPLVLEFPPNCGNLKIGSYCSIADKVTIFLGGNHRTDWITTYPFSGLRGLQHYQGHPATKGDVVIGSDVWIGQDATIMSGVIIGDGAVIGAKAVVSKSVSPYAIAVGNPAKCVKKRFADDEIEELLKIRWWDWENKKILNNMNLLLSSNIKDFIGKHKI